MRQQHPDTEPWRQLQALLEEIAADIGELQDESWVPRINALEPKLRRATRWMAQYRLPIPSE